MRALLSVYNKEGIVEFAKGLKDLGYEIVSTGGTAKLLKEEGISVREISEITGFPEILGGRVKTLHPKIHGGILYRDWVDEDLREIGELGIEPFDLVAVNLYPFEEKTKENLELRDLLEFIDIGGPTLIRASAKNFLRVTVVVDPKDYPWVLEKLRSEKLTQEDRARLAIKAFALTSYYDSLIFHTLSDLFPQETFPEHFSIPLKNPKALRYGENPHQKGLLALSPFESVGVARSKVLQGKEMSFNNYLDADSAMRIVSEFPNSPACVIVKHNNPCGVAVGKDLEEAFLSALETDPQSAFGGIVAFNDEVGKALAQKLTEIFLEVVVAPSFSQDALEVLSKKKNLRLLEVHGLSYGYDIKKISGGYLLQEEDTQLYSTLEVVSDRKPSDREMEDLLFAWKVCKYAKSNAVVIAKEGRTLGIGSGQVSRVDSLKCAIKKAKERGFDLKGAVLASEAFFPFRDSIDIASEEGITAVIHPSGSIRDKEVLEAVNEHNMAMVITKMRHFRH